MFITNIIMYRSLLIILSSGGSRLQPRDGAEYLFAPPLFPSFSFPLFPFSLSLSSQLGVFWGAHSALGAFLELFFQRCEFGAF